MLGVNTLEEKEINLIYNKFSIFDLVAVRIMLNYNRLLALAIVFLVCSLFSWSMTQALGTVGFLACCSLILYIQIRFKNPASTLLLISCMILTGLELISFWIK